MRSMYIIAAVIGLSACTPQPSQTLDEKLSSKTPAEKQEVLRLACLNEAEYTTDMNKAKYEQRYGAKRSHLVSDTTDTSRLKTICREMTDNYQK